MYKLLSLPVLFILVMICSCQPNRFKEKLQLKLLAGESATTNEEPVNNKLLIDKINLSHQSLASLNDSVLENISRVGFTHLLLTDVIAHDSYGITDYYATDKHAGTAKDFDELIQRANAHQLKILITLEPNFVSMNYTGAATPANQKKLGAVDTSLYPFLPTNNFYYLNNSVLAADHPVFHEEGSPGTKKLNYGMNYWRNKKKYFIPTPPTWLQMQNIMQFWGDKGIAGICITHTDYLPLDFWNVSIDKIKRQLPDLVFMAEVKNPENYFLYTDKGGFDFLLDEAGMYQQLNKADVTASGINNIYLEETRNLNNKMVRFSSTEIFTDSLTHSSLLEASLAAISLMHCGPVLLSHQQIFSTNDTSLKSFCKKLFADFAKNNSVNSGYFFDATDFNSKVLNNEQLVFFRFNEQEKRLVVINFDKTKRLTTTIMFPEALQKVFSYSDNTSLEFDEMLNDSGLRKTTVSSGIPVDVAAGNAAVYSFHAK